MAGERILVVDDEPGVRSALEGILADEGFEVVSADSGESGLARAQQAQFDAVLLDVWLPGMDGIETLQQLREVCPDTEVVMISGHGTIETAVRATKLGAFDFVEKPLSLERTLLVVRNALRQSRLGRQNQRLLAQLARDTEVVGASAAAARLREAIAVAAGTDAPVLLVGPLGSGRESAARRIHSTGGRAAEAFVDMACAAHAEGRILEALDERLVLAARGSLYLEDVERLAPDVQLRLAGSLIEASRRSDAPRLLASASPEIGVLAPELRQRLDVIRIDVPPLAERRDDIPLLAERFLRELAREYGRPPKRLTAPALLRLQSYGWPGNLRELRNVMERLLLLASGDDVRPEELPVELGGQHPPTEDLYRAFPSLAAGLAAFERYFVARVLAEVGGDRREAARRLGLTSRQLDDAGS